MADISLADFGRKEIELAEFEVRCDTFRVFESSALSGTNSKIRQLWRLVPADLELGSPNWTGCGLL